MQGQLGAGIKGAPARRLRHLVAYMRQQVPTTQILILGVLPRGAWSLPNVWAWPNRMTPGIMALNSASQVCRCDDPLQAFVGLTSGTWHA